MAKFKVLLPGQKHILSVALTMLSFMTQHENTTAIYINEPLKVQLETHNKKQTDF